VESLLVPVGILVLLGAVVWVVGQPLRRGARDDEETAADAERAELEAAKEAKYREIRDAELDHQMGKLTTEDHRAIDRELRADAIDILRRLDELEGEAPRA
jgi:hypothetical protein